MAYRQYTHCVLPADYVDPLPRTNNAVQTIAAIVDGLVLGGYLPDAILGCDYLLGGKLVCLGGDQCAIGHITQFEPARDKSFPANLDNDSSLGILLAPDDLDVYASIYQDPTLTTDGARWNKAYDTASAAAAPQGGLIREQNGMPIPHEDIPPDKFISPTFSSTYTEYPDANYPEYDPGDSPFQVSGSDGPSFRAPVLHLEAEGDRVCKVCAVVSAFTLGPIGKAICSATFLGIPIGSIICRIVGVLLSPLFVAGMLAAIAIAWAAARDGDENDPRVDANGGDLHFGDLIVASGRWTYDAGHTGWNEFHPVKTIQKLDPSSYDPAKTADLIARWCGLLAVVPPFGEPGVPLKPTDMTPAQSGTYDGQREPENQWILHPEIDGCQPGPPPIR